MFLIVSCEKQIALTLLIIFGCVTLLFLCFNSAIQNITLLEVGLFHFFVCTTFFSQNIILLGASDEQFLFNNSMSCYNFFARGCENGLLKIFTRPLDLLALHDACFYLLRALFYTAVCHVLQLCICALD